MKAKDAVAMSKDDYTITRRPAVRPTRATMTQADWFMREFDKDEVREYKTAKRDAKVNAEENKKKEELKSEIKKALLEDEKIRVMKASMHRNVYSMPVSDATEKYTES